MRDGTRQDFVEWMMAALAATLIAGNKAMRRVQKDGHSSKMVTTVHWYAGTEGWYVLTGVQCLRTPERAMIAIDIGDAVPTRRARKRARG